MDLTTQYLGLTLRNPLVASPGRCRRPWKGFARLAAAGVGAVVMYSLFEEQVRREQRAGRVAGGGCTRSPSPRR